MEAASVPNGKVNRWLLVSVVVLVVGLGGLVAAYVGKEATTKSAASTASPEAGPTDVGPVASLVMDPSDSSILYAGTQKGLFKSTDGARSWKQLPTPGGAEYTVYLDSGSPPTIYAQYSTTDTVQPVRLLRSDDGGATWVDLSDAGAPRQGGYLPPGMWFDTTSTPSRAYMWGVVGENGGNANLFRSTDRGRTWTRLRGAEQDQAEALRDSSRSMPSAARRALDAFMAPFEPNVSNWKPTVTVTDAADDSVLEVTTVEPIVDPRHPSVFYAGTEEGVYKSFDGGKTWNKASAGLGREVAASVGNEAIITGATSPPSAAATTSAGSGPEAGPTGFEAIGTLVMDPSNPSILYAGTAKGLFKSSDGARSWNRLSTGGEVIGVYVDPVWPSTVYAIDSTGLQRSDDGGATWADLSDAGTPRIYAYMPGVWFDTTSTPSTVYMWGLRDGRLNVWRSTDRGETWTRLSAAAQDKADALQGTPRANSVAVQQALDLFLASSGGTFGGFVTDRDSGARVEAIGTGPDAVIIDPDRASSFYIATKEGVYKSVDGGMTWGKASAGL